MKIYRSVLAIAAIWAFAPVTLAAAATPQTPRELVLGVITSSDPVAAYQSLSPQDRIVFDDEFAAGSIETVELTTPQPPQPAPIQARACTNYKGSLPAQGSRSYAGVTAYRYYLDMSYKYDCSSVWAPEITGATGSSHFPGFSYTGVSAKTAVRDAPHKARTKAQFNFNAPYGTSESSCLGINIVVTSAARATSADNSCRANP